MSSLFLDDVREAPIGFDVVRSFEEFTAYIEKNGVPDLISFDHDLGYNESSSEKTGYDCAKWLLDNGHTLKRWRIHSANPVGAERIRNLLEGRTP